MEGTGVVQEVREGGVVEKVGGQNTQEISLIEDSQTPNYWPNCVSLPSFSQRVLG